MHERVDSRFVLACHTRLLCHNLLAHSLAVEFFRPDPLTPILLLTRRLSYLDCRRGGLGKRADCSRSTLELCADPTCDFHSGLGATRALWRLMIVAIGA